MSKTTAISNSALYCSKTTPEKPLSETCNLQQTGTQRNQKVLLRPSIPGISGEYPPWKGLAQVQLSIVTDEAEAPSGILVANLGHRRTYLFRVLFFTCFNIFRLFELWHSPKSAVDLIHLIIHQISVELLLGSGTVLGTGIVQNKKDKFPAIMKHSSHCHTYAPNR